MANIKQKQNLGEQYLKAKEEELKVGDYAVVLEGYRGLDFTPGNIVKLVLDEKKGFQCLDVRTPYSKNTHFIYFKILLTA